MTCAGCARRGGLLVAALGLAAALRSPVRKLRMATDPRTDLSVPVTLWDEEPDVRLPRHAENAQVNDLLERTEVLLRNIASGCVAPALRPPSSRGHVATQGRLVGSEDKVYANNYVDMGAMEVIGFDYDYTLVTYKPALLYLIYDLARTNLVEAMLYPCEMLEELKGYDPDFAIRGLAVDLQTAWICHLTYNYRVSRAFFGRERVDEDSIRKNYSSEKGSGVMPPSERKRRLRPLNDLFSMVEACLLADVVQYFKDREIPFDPRSVVTDVLKAVGSAHISGAMHRTVVEDLDKYVEPDAKRHMRQLLQKMFNAGKKMMLVSNSQFWYVDAGMRHTVGPDWRDLFAVVVAPAGKPAFYTQNRPFREVSTRTGRVKFKPITRLEAGEVYCDGSIAELMKLTGWGYDAEDGHFDGSRILYLGDSLFADLVDARRRYGWVTGAIIREVRHEAYVQQNPAWRQAKFYKHTLLHCMRLCQEEMGVEISPGEHSADRQLPRSKEDLRVLDALEALTAKWRNRMDASVSPQFGSIFRTSSGFGSIPSLFAHYMRRHSDIYTSRVENFRLYSTDHRFYPSDSRTGNPHEAEPFSDSIMELLVGLSDFADFECEA